MKKINRAMSWFAKSEYAVLLILVVLVVVAGLLTPDFFTLGNISNVLQRASIAAIAAIGMTFVILTGGIDLSIGGIVVLVAYIGAATLVQGLGMSIWLAAPIMILIGGVLGAFNGVSIVFFGMPPLIATLAMMYITRGLATFIYQGATIFGLPSNYSVLGRGTLGGLPVPILISVVVFIATFIVLRSTSYGRKVYAVGSNSEAAWLTGVKVEKIVFSVYVICGLMAGLTAVLLSSRLSSVVGGLGEGMELDAIAAVVIGGTSLFGGEGGVFGSVIGALIITLVSNVLTLIGVSPFFQMVAKGLVLWAAVFIDMARRGYIFKRFGT